MDIITCCYIIRSKIGGVFILNKKYLLYGFGLTNKYVSKIFDIEKVEYIVFEDSLEQIDFEEVLKDIDVIIKSPGILFDTGILKKAKELGILVISDLELIYRLKEEKNYLVITGTNGKTTTTYLANCILTHDPNNTWLMGGNIGIPLFSMYKDDNIDGYLIEASSFMLHDTYTLKPHVFALTNISKHHLDFHKSFKNYCNDKVKIIKNMDESDYLIYNKDDQVLCTLLSKFKKPKKLTVSVASDATCYLRDGIIYYMNEEIVKVSDLKRGEIPFLYDIMIAIIIGKIYQVKNELIQEEIKSFTGLEFRFQKVYDENEVVIINDSKSTSALATYHAIKTIEENYINYKKIIIMGGEIKDTDYEDIMNLIKEDDELYFYGKSRHEFLNMFNHGKSYSFEKLDDLVKNIKINPKTVVLFSPSCQSYDQFDSYIDRGNVFNKLLKEKLSLA